MYVLQSDTFTFTHILLSLHGVYDEVMEINRRVIVVLKLIVAFTFMAPANQGVWQEPATPTMTRTGHHVLRQG